MAQENPRLKQLEMLQQTFASFTPFLQVTMKFLGFETTWLQKDIAQFLEYGPQNLMVQAQRGQAKSTITAIFAVWCLMQNPKTRVLIVSAGNDLSSEISTLITRIIMNMDILKCMRPDSSAGDRVSVEAFDVHFSLKGIDKSPSVRCIGIGGNLPGKRADLLIADDIESPKNARTATNREVLRQAVKEFAAICTTGRIVYLGTPQTGESIYNELPQKGFTVRIWPGRFPNAKQIEHYGDMLAPSILAAIERDGSLTTGGGLDGSRGKPTDPMLMSEETLRGKEREGVAYFELQYMLCTAISDEQRYPLKPKQLIVMRLGEYLPLTVQRGMTPEYMRKYQSGNVSVMVSLPMEVGKDLAKPTHRRMRIDPAGGGANGDESAYAVVDQLNGNIFIRAIGAVKGGYDEPQLIALADVVARWNPDVLDVEKNLGNGAFTNIILPYLRKRNWLGKVEETWEGGQKELRICDTLEPILGRGSLIIDESVLEDDWASTNWHEASKRQLFTFLHQFTKITRDRGALVKDDRLDALAGAIAPLVRALAADQAAAEARARAEQHNKWIKDPILHGRCQPAVGVRTQFASTIRRR
ncbi:phage terminase large subunit [Methanobrevibacter gottschalkii]|uniref:phage terminase large subunit n=2 Tax=cellular organisms TaxID=131567 RepID=UPI0038D1E9A4